MRFQTTVPDPAAESVDPVDEQNVELADTCRREGLAEAGAVGRGAGGVVAVAGDDRPAVLRRDVGVEFRLLDFDGERLVRLVGGPAGVGRDPHGSLRKTAPGWGRGGWHGRSPFG